MPIVTDRDEVLLIYQEALERKWVLPCFCTENLTTTEAILEAARRYAEETGEPDLPIIVAITNNYDHRAQSTYYTHTRKWQIGIKLFLADLHVLASSGSPYEQLRIMIHLDHIQFDDDIELLDWDMNLFSSIMFDASKVPFDENIHLTRAFCEKQKSKIVIEGACDEIVDATGEDHFDLTTPEKAERYFLQTGADMIVANLGTEHRASGKDLQYYSQAARLIKDKVGSKIVLHGASSVSSDKIAGLLDDGVCKVNIWTALERDTSPALLEDMVSHASEVAGAETAASLRQKGLLGPEAPADSQASINFFTTVYRQKIIYDGMIDIVYDYLRLWYGKE